MEVKQKIYIDIIIGWKIEIEITLDLSFSKGFQKIISNIILLLLFGKCTTYLFNIHIRTRGVEVSVNVNSQKFLTFNVKSIWFRNFFRFFYKIVIRFQMYCALHFFFLTFFSCCKRNCVRRSSVHFSFFLDIKWNVVAIFYNKDDMQWEMKMSQTGHILRHVKLKYWVHGGQTKNI